MISLNFASVNYRLIERIHKGLVAAIALLGLITAGMISAAVSLRIDVTAADQNLKERRAGDEKLSPILTERERLVKDLSAMAGLVDARKISWTRLLTRIEAVVPMGVALKSVEYKPETRMLVLEGMAQSPEALRSLVLGLEKSSAFKDPFLKHQSLEKGRITFNVVAVYGEHKGAGVASDKE